MEDKYEDGANAQRQWWAFEPMEDGTWRVRIQSGHTVWTATLTGPPTEEAGA